MRRGGPETWRACWQGWDCPNATGARSSPRASRSTQRSPTARTPFTPRWDGAASSLGRRWTNDILTGLDVERVDAFEDADFIVNIGPWRRGAALADYEEDLAHAAGLRLPMICANPDLSVMQGGSEMLCAGALAVRYEALGGSVAYHGKPHPAIYELCLARLGGPPRARVVAVGDSLATDIKGANAAGLASALVLGGLHAGEIGWRRIAFDSLWTRIGSCRPSRCRALPGSGAARTG